MAGEFRRRFVALEIGAHPVCPPVSARAAGVVQYVARCQDRNREQSGHRRLLAPRCRTDATRKSVKEKISRNRNTHTPIKYKPKRTIPRLQRLKLTQPGPEHKGAKKP